MNPPRPGVGSAAYSFSSEDIAYGAPGYITPLSAAFSPDGKKLTYLYPDERGARKVFAVDLYAEVSTSTTPGTAEEMSSNSFDSTGSSDLAPYKLLDLSAEAAQGTLSLQEQLRRERMRLFTSGISTYEWGSTCYFSPAAVSIPLSSPMQSDVTASVAMQQMIVPMNGKIIIHQEHQLFVPAASIPDPNWTPPTSVWEQLATLKLTPVEDAFTAAGTTTAAGVEPMRTFTAASAEVLYNGSVGDAVDPHLSPNGELVAFVSCDDLYAMHLRSGRIQRLTTAGASSSITCGLADFIAQEEMDRYRGFWWSPDSRSIVYAQADESGVPEYEIRHLGKADPTHCETHRYPFAGKVNPVVTLGVVQVPDLSPEAATEEEGTEAAVEGEVNTERDGVKTVAATADNGAKSNSVGSNIPATKWLQLYDVEDTNVFSSIAALGVGVDAINGTAVDYYIARVGWWPDGSVMAQLQNRKQSVLQLLRIDISSGERSIVLQEDRRSARSTVALDSAPAIAAATTVAAEGLWVNLHDMLHCFPADWKPPAAACAAASSAAGDFYFIWASERTGFSQLYFYQYVAAAGAGRCIAGESTPIGCCEGQPAPQFVIESINAVDEERCLVYFTGNRENPMEKHLYCASFLPIAASDTTTTDTTAAAGGVQRVTLEAGWHSCCVHPASGYIFDTYSAATVPVCSRLYRMNNLPDIAATRTAATAACLTAEHVVLDFLVQLTDGESRDPRMMRNMGFREAMVPPFVKTIRSSDDKVDLYCAIYLPPGAVYPVTATTDSSDTSAVAAAMKYPAIVSVYGGPHVQRVQNNWLATADLRAQRLAQSGFVVIKCDNRGSYRRGLEFEGALYRDMGNVEVVDQVTAVNHFADMGLIDPNRVGMFGWSYGGYMSAMSLCRAPDSFACAVAGAPVTSWDGYDTHYTERYMGLPQHNATGYESSSVMAHTSKMRGQLLLVHGLIDENVHFRHTARLINALIAQRKRYDLVLFPCERHSPHKMQDKVYMEDIITDYFHKHLQKTTTATTATVVLTDTTTTPAAITTATATAVSSSASTTVAGEQLKMTANL